MTRTALDSDDDPGGDPCPECGTRRTMYAYSGHVLVCVNDHVTLMDPPKHDPDIPLFGGVSDSECRPRQRQTRYLPPETIGGEEAEEKARRWERDHRT